MHVKIGHLVGPAFQDEKSPHTIPEQCSSGLYLVILSGRELPLYFRNQPTLLLSPIRQSIFPRMNQNEPTCWHWFCTSQQHRVNLFCVSRDSLSNVLRQLPCLHKPSLLQTKSLQFPQVHFLQGSVSTSFTIFITTSLLWALSKGSHPLLSDSRTDQGHVRQDGCLFLVLVLMFNDRHFRFKQRTMSRDPGLCVMHVVFRTLRHSTVGGIFMFGL